MQSKILNRIALVAVFCASVCVSSTSTGQEVAASTTGAKIVLTIQLDDSNHDFEIFSVTIDTIDGMVPGDPNGNGNKCGKKHTFPCPGLIAAGNANALPQVVTIIPTQYNPTCVTIIYGGMAKSFCK
jgi:hypothetical protein